MRNEKVEELKRVLKGGVGVLWVFVLAEVEVIYGSWLKVYGSRLFNHL